MKVQRHFLKHPNPIIPQLCEYSKSLYNQANFYMRQIHFWNYHYPDLKVPQLNINDLWALVKNEECCKNLHNTKTAKQTLFKLLNDWSNYWKALKTYKVNPNAFLSKPRAPKYKDKYAQVIFYNETVSRRFLKQNIIRPTNGCFEIKSAIKNFKQVVITPKTFGFIIEISYEDEAKSNSNKPNKDNCCAIDIGVNNLCAITSDQLDFPILVNGRIVKSINQWYNKKQSSKKRSCKRYFRLENYFHHVSKYIVQLCLENNIGTIIIGHNTGWKQNTKKDKRMRRKERQKFQYVPFYRLFQKIEYKASEYGIEIRYVNESYTSKCSYYDREELKHSEEYMGRRVKRGLFKSSDGRLLNADVNGSANIGRKVKVIQNGKDFHGKLYYARLDRSLAARPVGINPLNTFSEEISQTLEVTKIL